MRLTQGFFKRLRSRSWSVEDRMDLRRQVGLATSLLCFAIVAVMAIGAASIGRHEAINVASANLDALAATFADRVDRGVAARFGLLRHMASLEPLSEIWSGPPDVIRRVLEQARENFDGAEWLGYASTDGVIRAAVGGIREGDSVSDELWFRHGLVAPSIEDSSGAQPFTSGGSALAGEVDPRRFIDIGMPVHDGNGAVIGVLGLHISEGWAERLRRSTAGALSTIALSIVRSDGRTVVGDPALDAIPPDERIDAVTANFATHDADRTGYLSGFVVGRGTEIALGWLVVARQPAAIALGPANRLVWTIVALGVFIGLAGVLFSMLIATRVSRPFRRLAENAAFISRDSVATLPRIRGSLEAVRLSSALRALVLRITSAEKSTAAAEGRAADEAAKLNRDIAILRTLADVDVLTDLLNRRAFMGRADEAMAYFRQEQRPFAILMIDIDHFKRINDTLGHAAGDTVIRKVAATITGALRPGDQGARFGGEEFVLIIQDAGGPEAQEAAERIRALVAETPIECGETVLLVTISVGVALADSSDFDVQALVERADLALYAAKDAGRDQVVVAPPGAREFRRIA